MATINDNEIAGEILRTTRSACPVCGKPVAGAVVRQDGRAYLQSTCPEHGAHRLLLSVHAELYADLERVYFAILGREAKQGRLTRYWILSTSQCQSQCRYCSVKVRQPCFDEMTATDFQHIFRQYPGVKLSLMGGEPTLHPAVYAFFQEASRQGHLTDLVTNGIRLADPEFCRRLAAAGVNWVRLSVDSLTPARTDVFDTGEHFTAKLHALENLGNQRLATTLAPTIFRGVNEDQLIAAVEYANEHPFIRDISVNGFSWVGEGVGLPRDLMIMPDEMMDVLHRRFSRGPREDLFTLQKWFWIALRVMRIRLCFYTQLTVFVRDPRGPRPLTDFLDMAAMKRAVKWWQKYAGAPRVWQFIAMLIVGLRSLNRRTFKLIGPLLRLFFASITRRAHSFPSALIPVVINTNCSLLSADEAVAANCNSGILYLQDGELREGISAEFLIRREQERLARESAT